MINNQDEIVNFIPTLLASFILVISSSVGVILAVIGCVFLDTFVGLWKVVKRIDKWRWKKFWNIWFKSIFYIMSIAIVFILDGFLLNEFWESTFNIEFIAGKVTAILFAWMELRSVDKSIQQMNCGKGLRHYINIMIEYIKEYKEDINNIRK